MKSMEQLEKMYEKEIKLSEQHKKNAVDIKKQMDQQMGKAVMQKINSYNMTGAEYDKLIKLLGNGKKSVMEAADLILGNGGDGKPKLEEKTGQMLPEQGKEEKDGDRKETA